MTDTSPEEAVFWNHIRSGRFQNAAARGRWRLVEVEWPHVVCGVRAADGREFGFRFECSNYPRTPATARPWDLELNAPLDSGKWPTGRDRIPLAFNPEWQGGQCLYLPCDRRSIEGHANWPQQYPHLAWDSSLGIGHYLRIIFDLLNSGDYEGLRGS